MTKEIVKKKGSGKKNLVWKFFYGKKAHELVHLGAENGLDLDYQTVLYPPLTITYLCTEQNMNANENSICQLSQLGQS